jgi:hypothetical protein
MSFRRTSLLRNLLFPDDTMKSRIPRFGTNFLAALGHCALEESELIGPVLLVFGLVGLLLVLSVVTRIAYEIFLDPNSADVSARLACLSIDPGNWT